jgi:hypothetical protein
MHLSTGLQSTNEECLHGIFGRGWESDMYGTSGDPIQPRLDNEVLGTLENGTPSNLKTACIK